MNKNRWAAFCTVLVAALFSLSACGGQDASLPLQSGAATVVPGPSLQHVAGVKQPFVYVTVEGVAPNEGGAVLAFSARDSGDVTPAFEIAGPSTHLQYPHGIAVSPQGAVFVVNTSFFFGSELLEFGPGARGDVAPVRTLSCGGMIAPFGVAVSPSGTVAVSNVPDSPHYGVAFFGPSDAGCVSGNRLIAGPPQDSPVVDQTRLGDPTGIAFDNEDTVYALNSAVDYGIRSVTEYTAGASGNVSPARTIAGPHTGLNDGSFPYDASLALDRQGNVYVAQDQNGSAVPPSVIFEYPANTGGDVAPRRIFSGNVLQSANVAGIAVDAQNRLFVLDDISGSIFVYDLAAPTAKPVHMIGGLRTGLRAPSAIAVYPGMSRAL